MIKHTKGPWIYQEWGRLILDSGEGSSVKLVATVALNTYRDEGTANARLIAAAPDLLEALQDVISWVPGRTQFHTDAAQKAVSRANDAIAKALGEKS